MIAHPITRVRRGPGGLVTAPETAHVGAVFAFEITPLGLGASLSDARVSIRALPCLFVTR